MKELFVIIIIMLSACTVLYFGNENLFLKNRKLTIQVEILKEELRTCGREDFI